MQEGDRDAFDTILAELFAAIDKPLGEAARSAFWKGLANMSLLEFARTRDMLLVEFGEGEAPRRFGVSDIWAAKRRLRAQAPAPLVPNDGWDGDKWDQRANLRLLSHIIRTTFTRRKRIPDEETRTLAAFKNYWADLMRKCAVDYPDGEVPLGDQDDTWTACMQQAAEAREAA